MQMYNHLYQVANAKCTPTVHQMCVQIIFPFISLVWFLLVSHIFTYAKCFKWPDRIILSSFLSFFFGVVVCAHSRIAITNAIKYFEIQLENKCVRLPAMVNENFALSQRCLGAFYFVNRTPEQQGEENSDDE